jgi:prolyl-tRNA synthetase
MGGTLSHEFIYPAPIGEETLLKCPQCGYTANQQAAKMRKVPNDDEPLRPIEKVSTAGVTTIEQLSAFLTLPPSRIAKTLALVATFSTGGTERQAVVLAVVRGDMEVNETKIARALHATALRPAHEAEMHAAGLVPGYTGPVGIRDIMIVVDDLIPQSRNLTVGANETDHHLTDVNYARDFSADIIADIATAQEGSLCPRCGTPMTALRGVEVGHIFKLGTKYSESMGCTFLDRDGTWKPVVMGSYGIGTGRLLACAAEEHHDGLGLCWPVTVAPYQVHLVMLPGDTPDVAEAASRLYADLRRDNVDVLFDDRPESAGVKFMDADLIGLPLRVTVSKRSLGKGGVEFKLRTSAERDVISISDATSRVQNVLSDLVRPLLV